MSNFTKGPWEFVASGEYGYSVLWNPESRDEILVTGGINDGDSPITWMGEELRDANRSLIEAAPDLYESLKAVEWGNKFKNTCPSCFSCQSQGHAPDCLIGNALKKAEGGGEVKWQTVTAYSLGVACVAMAFSYAHGSIGGRAWGVAMIVCGVLGLAFSRWL